MKTNDIFNREIIRHILGNLGMVPPPNFGKVGISTEEFKQQKTLLLEFESRGSRMETIKFPLWGGKIESSGAKLNVLATDLFDENYHEFVVVFQTNGETMHGIKHNFDEQANLAGFFMFDGVVWKNVSTITKLKVCLGFELLNDWGLTWEPANTEFLLPNLLSLIEEEDNDGN